MDAIDILGGLLGHKASRGGMGADILKDILGGGLRPPSRPQPGSVSAKPSSHDIQREAKDLEDLLSVANGRSGGRRSSGASTHTADTRAEGSVPAWPQPKITPRSSGHVGQSSGTSGDVLSQNEQALVLVRAMVNAAKSDGQIDQSEQQKILERMGDASTQAIQFLRDEFARPLDVREFAWSVPIGMEQKVYTLSLIAIDLDTNREANYLSELAHGLRIPESVRDQIHQRLGAPQI